MDSRSNFKLRRLHEATLRHWCRAALACFAFCPLAILMAWSTVIATPWYRAWEKRVWEQRVSDTLGIDVKAKSFQWTAPYQFHADEVEIRNPESDVLMGRIGRIDGLMKSRGWSVILDAPAIDGAQLRHGIDVLHDWFLCRPQRSSQLLALAIPNGITIHQGTSRTSFERVEIVFRPSTTVSTVQAKWSFEDQPFGDVSLNVSREHASEASTTKLELSSQNAWLPCGMLGERLGFLDALGPDTHFRGVVRYQHNYQSWDASVSGELQQLDLGAFTAGLGAPLRGQATVLLEHLNVRDGRLLLVSGECRTHGASVGRGWMQRFAQCLNLPSHWQPSTSERVVLDQTGFRFRLDPDGLRVKGVLPGPIDWPPVAAKLEGSIVFADQSLIPVSQLVLALQPEQVAGSRESLDSGAQAAALSAVLPWPAALQSDRRESAAANSLRSRLSRTKNNPPSVAE